jgi:RNA polymerase sigma-70 factor (sigma-E family)
MTDGDSAYVAFVEEGWARYLRLARLLTGDRHRAEELLQDSLVKLYLRWRRVSARGDPHAYLRRMLVTGNVSRWRRVRREHLVGVLPDRPAPGQDEDPDRDELWCALLDLPARQRAVVVLRYYEDLTERETAAVLGCTVGTVKSQNARAMARLRTVLPAHNQTDRHDQTKRTVRP